MADYQSHGDNYTISYCLVEQLLRSGDWVLDHSFCFMYMISRNPVSEPSLQNSMHQTSISTQTRFSYIKRTRVLRKGGRDAFLPL